MVVANISKVMDGEWCRVEPVVVGRNASGLGTLHRHVLVSDDERPLLRLDVYVHEADCYAFEDALIWQGHVVVGFGSNVHLVSLRDRSIVSLALGEYFGHFYPTTDYLLVASGERLFRIESDRSVAWTSDVLGIDGVVVSNPGPPVIVGEGEWDPPGGWQPFSLLSSTGRSIG
jgi:hypothetical protein